jgi:hypothetical protein
MVARMSSTPSLVPIGGDHGSGGSGECSNGTWYLVAFLSEDALT